MGFKPWITAFASFLGLAAPAAGQGLATGTLAGRVSCDDQALPGVTVTLTSPSLPGTRLAITNGNGDYEILLLTPASYQVKFELEGFVSLERTVEISVAKTSALDANLSLVGGTETIELVHYPETIVPTPQADTTHSWLIRWLPVDSSFHDLALLAPGVHDNGVTARLTLAGAPSSESLFLINGVEVNDLRGQPLDLIADAVGAVTLSTSGLSAEYGRFAGGMVNVLTTSGGGKLYGSVRARRTDRVDERYEATLGGWALPERLSFFLAGRRAQAMAVSSRAPVPFPAGTDQRRGEGTLILTLGIGHRLTGSHLEADETDRGDTALDRAGVGDRKTAQGLTALDYTGALTNNFFLEGRLSKRRLTVENLASDGQENFLAKAQGFAATPKLGAHDLAAGFDAFDDLRAAAGSTPDTAQKTRSVFANDFWRLSSRWSFNVGARYDRSRGTSAGLRVAGGAKVSPRLGASFDPQGDGQWSLNAAYGKYVAAPADLAIARQPAPGSSLQILRPLHSPETREVTVGLVKRLGSRGIARADLVYRQAADFYSLRTDLVTGSFTLPTGQSVDRTLLENESSDLSRTYRGLHAQFQLRATDRLSLGGVWTLAKTHGNVDGETAADGPAPATIRQFPEYKEARWNAPKGDLATDQRHRIRLWGLWSLIDGKRHDVTLGFVQSYQTGTPYGAVGFVDAARYVANPGYALPPAPTDLVYYYTARDAFRTDDISATDLKLSYRFKPSHSHPDVEFFLKPEVLNVFDQKGVVVVNTTVQDPTTTSSLTPFNPFTQAPVEGVNWRKGPAFGQPTSATSYQTPRTFRFSVGVRF